MPSTEPLPNLQADGEDPGTRTSRRHAIDRERNHQKVLLSQDEEDYEILASAQADLSDLDAKWRLQTRDRPSLFLDEIAEIDTIALALHTATINWPWARLIVHIESIAPRFESLFKLACLEFHLRETTLNGPELDHTRYRSLLSLFTVPSSIGRELFAAGRSDTTADLPGATFHA